MLGNTQGIDDAVMLKDAFVTLGKRQYNKGFRVGLWLGVAIAAVSTIAVALCRWI